MKTNTRYHLRLWETALLVALCLALCTGAWAENRQSRLSGSLIRLHVVAVSDSETEQAIKLRVRDAVLESLAPLLEGERTAQAAAAVIEENLPALQQAAEAASHGRPVSVFLGEESYPTRNYEGFSLPAGEYASLRVVLGEGQGRNWWCVVFPPLCMGGSLGTDPEAVAVLDDEDMSIITASGGEYVIKFRILELWGRFKELIDTK